MSEQTTDTSKGLVDGVEPSMEDILASIRKIIADDESIEAPLELNNDIKTDTIDTNIDAPTDEVSIDLEDVSIDEPNSHAETLDLDIIADIEPTDSEIDALIADMDMIEDEVVTAPVAGEVDEPASDDLIELVIPEEDETEVPHVLEEDESTEDESTDDELSALLDDMMGENHDETGDDDIVAEVTDANGLNEDTDKLEQVLDPAENLLDDEDEFDVEFDTELSKSDSDMDLVKSLMADLTGAPLHDESFDDESLDEEAVNNELEAIEDIPSDDDEDIIGAHGLDILESEPEPEGSVSESSEIDTDENTNNVMDEILSLTLGDEIEIQDNVLEASDIEVPVSLKDIAAQAEADAKAISGEKALAAVTALGAAAAATQAAAPNAEQQDEISDINESDDIDDMLSKFDEIVMSEADTEIETDTDLTPDEETTQMPRAVKKDAIIDEVTESATADVFSSLNKVVEEKAVVAERGDRIGDLVQEALRPMLKEWLDANLKGIVERAVTKEVKRISSGK